MGYGSTYQSEERSTRVQNRKILLVEDNPNDELLALRALKKNGIGDEVVVARNGAEALDYLFGTGTYAARNAEIMPWLILLDLKLPGMDGLEVLGRLRSDERTRRLPVVVLTSYEGEYEAISGSGLHADGAIRKAVDFTDFSQAIQRLVSSPRGTGETGSPTGRSTPLVDYRSGRNMLESGKHTKACAGGRLDRP
jgi:two-component system response regulator